MRLKEIKTNWAARGLIRRDFRHTHDGPEVPKYRKWRKRKKKRCWKVPHEWTKWRERVWYGVVKHWTRECLNCRKREWRYNLNV